MAKSARSGEPAFTTRKISKLGAVLGTAALTLSGLVAVSTPAHANLAGVGPTDPSTGFPSFYTDESGMSLQPCIDSITLCIADATGPISAPDGEAFYWAADASVAGIDGHWALEAAFGEAGEPEVFQRTQYTSEEVFEPSATYTITDPFGISTVTTSNAGVFERDRVETEPGFEAALTGRLGPFLTATAGAPAGYIGGGPDSSSTVTGSPTGFNMFRVQGPGITGTCTGGIPNCAETSLFAISGKLAPGAAAQVDLSPLDFGNTASPVPPKIISYSSVGTLAAEVSSVASNNPAFTATHNCGSVASGASCSISVTYTPTAGASADGVLTITDNTGPEGAANVRTINMSGRSLAVSSVNATSLAFGSQKVVGGPSPAKSVTVTNVGKAPMTVSSVSSSSGDFIPTGCATAVAPDASCTISVEFDPSATGNRSGTLSINTNGGNKSVALSGTGTTASIASVTGYTFTDTAMGASRTGTVTVTNSGDAAMVLGARTLGGANASDFRLGSATAGQCQETLNGGASCQISVVFAPRALGARSATLTVRGDDAVHTIALSGRGVDRTLPVVVSRGPAANSTAVRRGANVSVGLSEAVRGVSRATFRLTNRATGRTMRATVTRAGTTNRWVLNPSAQLSARTRYTARLVGGRTAVRDMSNNALRSTSWSFRTR